ncbi:MAG: hypothetical protein AAGJ19_12470 [Myxococcota bacterium]
MGSVERDSGDVLDGGSPRRYRELCEEKLGVSRPIEQSNQRYIVYGEVSERVGSEGCLLQRAAVAFTGTDLFDPDLGDELRVDIMVASCNACAGGSFSVAATGDIGNITVNTVRSPNPDWNLFRHVGDRNVGLTFAQMGVSDTNGGSVQTVTSCARVDFASSVEDVAELLVLELGPGEAVSLASTHLPRPFGYLYDNSPQSDLDPSLPLTLSLTLPALDAVEARELQPYFWRNCGDSTWLHKSGFVPSDDALPDSTFDFGSLELPTALFGPRGM